MASKLNYSDVVKGNIRTRTKFTMNYHETFKHSDWTQFRNIAVEIRNHAKKIGLNLKLDDITYGDGSCFMVAVMQQCLRLDVKIYLPDDILRIAEVFDVMAFKRRVGMFMLNSRSPSVLNYRARYEKIAMPILKKSWIEYWNHMMQRYTWADTHFVQGTAFMLGIDVWIVTTKSKGNNPYTKTLSDMNTPQNPGIAPPLLLGLKGECHYQSLLHNEETCLTLERSSIHPIDAEFIREDNSSANGNVRTSTKNMTYAEVAKKNSFEILKKVISEKNVTNVFMESTSSENGRKNDSQKILYNSSTDKGMKAASCKYLRIHSL